VDLALLVLGLAVFFLLLGVLLIVNSFRRSRAGLTSSPVQMIREGTPVAEEEMPEGSPVDERPASDETIVTLPVSSGRAATRSSGPWAWPHVFVVAGAMALLGVWGVALRLRRRR
jgi:hypothetical protein